MIRIMFCLRFACLLAVVFVPSVEAQEGAATLPDTEPLTWEGDLAERMLAGVDRFLLRAIENSIEERSQHWQRDYSSPAAYSKSLGPQRERLEAMLGLRDERLPVTALEFLATTDEPARVGRGSSYDIFAVRWPVLEGVTGEGLWLVPRGGEAAARADVIALADAEHTPEMLVGLAEGIAPESQFARRLAESGCRVLVPTLISRSPAPRAAVTGREYLYRSAFVLGRHIIGYELQKVFAAADWLQPAGATQPPVRRLGIMGYGEGGMLALYAGAIDERFAAVGVSGHFAPREDIWQQPIDRNVFGLLEQFGDAELASMIPPRALVIEASRFPEAEVTARSSAPYRLTTPPLQEIERESARLTTLLEPLDTASSAVLVTSGDGTGPFGSASVLDHLLGSLGRIPLAADGPLPERLLMRDRAAERQLRQWKELDQYNQQLIVTSSDDRAAFMARLDTSSVEAYEQSVAYYREYFRHEIIGHFEQERLPLRPRTRKAYDHEKWTGYEVVLDVFPDVFAYGVLLIPKGIQPNERRPVVVCQHGLEGRPQHVIEGDTPAYHDFAARLAERGFITFAPQNLYVLGAKFRTIQRKAYPLKKTMFSVMVPQHEQIVSWLKTLPQVDPERIGFYGLSYGGVSAMRIPPLIPDYCLSICSANFNDWILKTASSRAPYAYPGTAEYEIFEFNLGGTFNYAEMAALIAPRLMVERGHFDGVGTDDVVASEFAKVRYLYEARLNLPGRCAIEWFPGKHEIHGAGTFEFLEKHLNWKATR